jgi:DNA-binding NarL/FixJ family response regulator
MDGFETCKHIRSEHSNLPVIILTQFDNKNVIGHFLSLGVHSFLSKGASADELNTAVKSAVAGEKNLASSADLMFESYKNKQLDIKKVELTHQEKLLLQLLKVGCTSKEIAGKMNWP